MTESMPVLREYLYVDIQKVRGLLAQLDDGIVETMRIADKLEKVTGLGVKGIADHSRRSGEDSTSEKAMGDALFPILEDALMTTGFLRDLSEELQGTVAWAENGVAATLPLGSLVRITAQGRLFDARYIASTFSGMLTASQGLEAWPDVATEWASQKAALPPKAKSQAQKSKERRQRAKEAEGPRFLEDELPDVDSAFGTEISREFLEGLIRLARGLYAPGVHLFLKPTGNPDHAVFARLEEGRQYLDSEPEVLFSRYGMGEQEWTVVGSIGSHDDRTAELKPDFSRPDETSISRVGMAEFINMFMQILGRTGMSNLPQWPSFSVVPLAVYRTVHPWG